MLKEDTIKREMRRLRKIIEGRGEHAVVTDRVKYVAYGMESFGQWVLGGCDWTPSKVVLPSAR